MKLVVNAAADSCSLPIRVPDPRLRGARRSSRRGSGHRERSVFRVPTWALPVLLTLLVLFGASVASALEGINLSRRDAEARLAADGTANGEGCSQLFRIKYPFLSCTEGRIGSRTVSATWENSRRMPTQSEWIEGDGAWGPERNQD